MSAPRLLSILKEDRTWREVGALLGGEYSGAFWRFIAIGQRHATVDQENVVRSYLGIELLEESPAGIIERSGVDRVVQVSKRPNTAILVAVSGDVCRVTIKAGELPAGVSPACSVTLGYRHQEARNRPRGSRLSFISKIDVSGLETVRGKSGNLAAISAAAMLAAQAYQERGVLQ